MIKGLATVYLSFMLTIVFLASMGGTDKPVLAVGMAIGSAVSLWAIWE